MGVMEAVHFGVPMIGIPVFGDQQSNVANCVEKGIAIGLDYRQITERKLIRSIQAIVTEDKCVILIFKPGLRMLWAPGPKIFRDPNFYNVTHISYRCPR